MRGDPTNNTAERALRHAVIWRKLSHGTQTDHGNRLVERLLSIRETCRLNGIRPHDYFTRLIEADLTWPARTQPARCLANLIETPTIGRHPVNGYRSKPCRTAR